jgi:hypothetical protein
MRGFGVSLYAARIPDHDVETFFIGTRGTSQIGIELVGTEFRGGDGQADIFLVLRFAFEDHI